MATMERAGYFIFTIPEEMREVYREKEKLSELRTYLRRKLKRVYPGLRAVTRWHWFGDQDLVKYHPHLNILVDGLQKVNKETLEEIKFDYKRALEKFTGIQIDKKVDVYYHFLTTKKRICHVLRYISRPSFLIYQKNLAMELKGYRNTTIWGKFRELTLGEMERWAIQRESNTEISKETLLLANNICPCCGGQVRWFREVYPGSLASMGEELGEGYYSLPIRVRGSPDFKFPNLEEMELIKAMVEDSKWRRRFADFEEDKEELIG